MHLDYTNNMFWQNALGQGAQTRSTYVFTMNNIPLASFFLGGGMRICSICYYRSDSRTAQAD